MCEKRIRKKIISKNVIGKKEYVIPAVLIGLLAMLIMIPALAGEEQKESSGFVVPETVIASGNVTDTVTWKITEDDAGSRTLVIGGTGPMSDYGKQADLPWLEWKGTLERLIIEDGVTRIGNNAMYGFGFKEVQIGQGVETIGKHAFAYGTNLESIRIPGNVKVLEANAFVYHRNLRTVTLEEGVEVLEHSSLGCEPKMGDVLHIPASLKRFDDLAVWMATEYTVEEENPYFMAVDGILYNKDFTALVDYPKYKDMVEYRVPDSVCEIKKGSVHRIRKVKRMYIPSTVQIVPASYMFQWSDMEEIYIEDGVPLSGETTFAGCTKLVSVRLPENIPIEKIYNMFQQGCNCIESLKIPSGTQRIESFGSPTKSLSQIIYDARNAVMKDNYLFDREIRYSLMIGESVDSLPKEFRWITGQADSITFQKPNLFHVEAGAFESRESPVNRLEGHIYIDHQGVFYQLDEEGRTASIVYCQTDFEELYIPAVISPEAGEEYELTAVGKDSFKNADQLQAITFEKPEQVTVIEAYGFAKCTGLKEVNGQNEIKAVKELFSNAEIGYRPFYQTGLKEEAAEEEGGTPGTVESMTSEKEIRLEGREGASDLLLSMESESGTLEWKQDENGSGQYQLLTGDTLTILSGAGNKEAEDNYRYRIYFQKTEEDGNISISPGQTYVFDSQTVECHETEDPLCIYIEFAPLVGKTLSIPVTVVYPSPGSAGGGVTVWAVMMEKEEAEQARGKLVLSEFGALRAEWVTVRDEFLMTKSGTGSAELYLKGLEDGTIIPGSDFNWKIVLERLEETAASCGNDYVQSVVYKDVMTLPKGLSWHEDVVAGIKDGTLRKSGSDYYAGDRRVFRVTLGGGQLNLSGVRITWDEQEEQAVIQFTVRNMAGTAQMNTNTVTVIYFADAFMADLSEFHVSEAQTVTNRAEAAVFYQHSGKVLLSSEAGKTIAPSQGTLKLSQTVVTKPYYFGEEADYQIMLCNPGAMPYMPGSSGEYRLQEVLSPYVYMEPEDMERMFREEEGKYLSVFISGTELVPWEEGQGVYAGTVFWKHGGNSGQNLSDTAKEQLTIQWNDSKDRLQVIHGDDVYEKETLEESLQAAGFVPGRWTEYTLSWTLNESEDVFSMEAGETRRFHVYGRAKDTFQMLSEDWPGAYPTDAFLTLTCQAMVLNPKNAVLARSSGSSQVIREAYVRKQAVMEDKILKDSFTAEDGSCITYTLELRHFGKGNYENLPIVDEMYGAQALLVPAEENPHLADQGLGIYRKEDTVYYVLTEGVYHNVKIGGVIQGESCVAADILVEKVIEEQTVEYGEISHSYNGLHTTVFWNFAEIPAGSYRLYLSYQSIVDQKLSGKNVYSLGNVVWMNGRENSRIYGTIWGGGSIIDFRKDILETKGITWKDDVIDKDGYSILSAGEKVTYRLTLRCKGDGQYRISGSDMADRLPDNHGVFPWISNENVTLAYESTHSSTQISGMEQWSIENSWNGGSKEGQQYILWPDDMSVCFSENDAKVYIYITLTYPEHTEQDSVWTEYRAAVDGAMIENTFFVYQFPVNVSHHLRETGRVLLQKGVYAAGYGSDGSYKQMPSRIYYNNRDSSRRQVTYYLVLYNGGTKRWYLNDVYDILPKGFTMQQLVADGDLNRSGAGNSIMTQTDFNDYPLVQEERNLISPEPVEYRSANIQWGQMENGYIRFRIGAGEGEQAVSYDEKKQQYYLNFNEAITFGYMCETGMTEETEDIARNTAVMNYTDYPKTGVELTDENQIRFTGSIDEVHNDQNDGNSSLLTGADMKGQYDFIYGDLHDYWLNSDVVVSRGEIIPGVTKYTESYTSSGSGLVTEYETAAGPYDVINWRVRLHNSGTLSITDYTFEDILPESYVLCGDLRYEIHDCFGNLMKKQDVLTVTGRTEDTVTIINNNSKKTISLDGKEEYINLSGSRNGKIALSKTENGKERIAIRFSDYDVSIPEGGYVDLYLSSYNPTNQYKNTVYTNQAFLTPNRQTFSKVGQGSMERAEDGTPESAKNSSPVTITFGYATGSRKGVSEKSNPENMAVSTDPDNNYILLSKEDGVFTYELTVTNDTDKAMEKLILIDRLPEEGDTSPFDSTVERLSEFSVSLAENPNVTVKVKTKEGEVYELTEEDYSIEYSKKTVFTEEDWNGADSGNVENVSASENGGNGTDSWSSRKEGARSMRVLIRDAQGRRIPAKSEVTVSFDCIINDDGKAGEIAWNSFGYHYKLLDLGQELEAMPLSVGVKIPNVPVLKKQLEDRSGTSYPADEREVFHYVLYEGEAVSLEDVKENLNSKESFVAWLEEQGRQCWIYSVYVEQGSSESEELLLESAQWIQGQKYTIVEMKDHPSYELKNVNGIMTDQYTFLYEKDEVMILRYTNMQRDWRVELFKTDADEEQLLEGAEFAFYSPNAADCMDVSRSLEGEDGQTWYLKSVKTTDSEGKIVWDDLKENKYYIMETMAPDGYERQEEGFTIYDSGLENGRCSLHVKNERGKVFPHTGSIGSGVFVAVGTILISSSCVMKCGNKDRTKRNGNEKKRR